MRSPFILIASLFAALAAAACDITIVEPCGCPTGVTVGVSVAASSAAGSGGAGGSTSTSSSATSGVGGSGGAAASSSSGGHGCPPCSAGIAGAYLADELCPVSTPLFDALLACACATGGACAIACLIPEVMPGDGATCPLTSTGGASTACVDCLAAVSGCAASFAVCVADTGS